MNHSLQIIDISHFDSWLHCCSLLLYLIVSLDTLDSTLITFPHPALDFVKKEEGLLKRKIKFYWQGRQESWSHVSWNLELVRTFLATDWLSGKSENKIYMGSEYWEGEPMKRRIFGFNFILNSFLCFSIFLSILLCSGCYSLLPALNYRRRHETW